MFKFMDLNNDILLLEIYQDTLKCFKNYYPWSMGQYQSLNILGCLGSIQLCAAVLGATVQWLLNTTSTSTLTGTHLLLGAGSKYGKVSCSRTQVPRLVAVRIGTHILTSQQSEHKSDAVDHLAFALHLQYIIVLLYTKNQQRQTIFSGSQIMSDPVVIRDQY